MTPTLPLPSTSLLPSLFSPTLRSWLLEKPFALGMSSGFFGFFAHCGVLSVLDDEGLLPIRGAGSSAGALVLGAWASGLPASELSRALFDLNRSDFWDPSPGFGLLKGQKFHQKLEALLPVRTFEACRIPLAISAYNLQKRQTEVLDTGDLIRSIRASCAFPFLFQPVLLGTQRYLDGGIADRSGLAGLPHDHRTFFHHLASRSPWRRPHSQALQIPSRPDLATLVIASLPRVGPFRLERGKLAFSTARQAMQKALDLPLVSGRVSLDALLLPAPS